MKKTTSALPTWNLSLLYSSPTDPRIERDVVAFEKSIAKFAATYDVPNSAHLSDSKVLLAALTSYEKLVGASGLAAVMYFFFLRDIEAGNAAAQAANSLLDNRLAQARNKIAFFEITLGAIPKETQQRFLAAPELAHFKVFLSRIFDDARYSLSVPEEKIMNLKSQTAYEMWISANERILNMKTVLWKGKQLPLSQGLQLIATLKSPKEREAAATAVARTLKEAAPFAEAEINAIFTDKKINDELRAFSTPFEQTVLGYRNDPAVVERLVKTVTDNFAIAHSFSRVKARLIGRKRLAYSDRAAKIGTVKTSFSFSESLERLKRTFGAIDPKYRTILERFIEQGQIDAPPRVGKRSGAYCWGSYEHPSFVLLNHTGELHSFTTFAHEMGHAFHTELSRSQGPIYSGYSTALAETASTLFEAIALDAVFNDLPEKEKIIVLYDKISDDIATIFRQIACFNFEKDLHDTIRAKGYIDHKEIAEIHNKNMKAYLGPLYDMKLDDGYFFVRWEHIRRFFYVYTYAYGALVSKAMLRKYRADPSFWKKIEQFLSAGGKDSPEAILKEIGIDVSSPTFWREGLAEIEENIARLDALLKSSKTRKR